MMREAEIGEGEHGKVIASAGWFIVGAGELQYDSMPRGGAWCGFEAPGVAQQIGVGIHVLWPGDTTGRYHFESDQEGFLVLSGECLAIIEGTEHPMRQWDYFHCPPGTEHIMVGAGD